jgi:23S rRNA pseudouridine1911/1915/1917 synthase
MPPTSAKPIHTTTITSGRCASRCFLGGTMLGDMMTTLLDIAIDAAQQGERLDKALSERCEHSRSYLQQLIAQGNVFLLSSNGAAQPVLRATQRVQAGQCYRLRIPALQPYDALTPIPMPLDIVYEDTALLVINKPAGLTVHPASSTQNQPTLVHGLLAHCGDSLSGIGGVARPGIVHRLDKDTSGLMLVAKHDKAHQHLSAQLKDRSLSRTYQALCWGRLNPPRGTLEGAIGRHPKDRTRMAVVSKGGKPARTHYATDAVFMPACPISAITCQLETGRTHQIRVHLAQAGHPLLGDPLYGIKHWQQKARQLEKVGLDAEKITSLQHFNRQALHASRIRFLHPDDGQEMTFSAPLPPDLASLFSLLKDLPSASH